MPGEELIAAGIGGVVGIAETLIESGKAKKANRDLKRLFKQRKAFKTPKEVFDIVNLTESNAAQGFSDQTLQYMTAESEAGLASGLGTAKLLGGDPNQLSGYINQFYKNIFATGAESDLAKMKKFDSYANALGLLAQNKEAEWASADNLIKDQMAAAAARLQSAQKGMDSGANFAIQALTNLAASDLFGDDKKPKTPQPRARGYT